MSYIFTILFPFIILASVFGQTDSLIAKKSLDHSVYTQWKNIESQKITDNGLWLSYEINPAKGDGFLYIYNTETGKKDSIPRGKNAEFSPDGSFLAFLIEPQYDTVRALKLNKVNPKKLPKDSLGIYFLAADSLLKIPMVKSFSIPDSSQAFIVYNSLKEKKIQAPKKKSKGWWIFKKKKKKTQPEVKTPKPKGDNLVLYYPNSGKKIKYDFIDEYTISHDGKHIGFIKNNEDIKKPKTKIIIINSITNAKSVYKMDGMAKSLSFSYSGDLWAFLNSADTLEKNKVYSLYYGNISKADTAYLLADSTTKFKTANFCPSEFSQPVFSHDGTKLYFGAAPIPQQEPKDSLLDNEKYHVDIWSYHDETLQPQQLKNLRRELRKSYLCFYQFEKNEIIQIEEEDLEGARLIQKGNGNIALASNNKKYRRMQSWGGFLSDYYIINLFDGSSEIVLEAFEGYPSLSADGNYVLYFNGNDKIWYAYDVKARKHQPLTKDIDVNFFDEDNDMPTTPGSYGIAGWFKGDKYVVINDRYDLWLIDPTGKQNPQNLTNSFGRKNKIKLRYNRLDRDERYFNESSPNWLHAFNEVNKQTGYFILESTKPSDPKKIIMSDCSYRSLIKPKLADMFFVRKMSFTNYPEIYMTDMKFQNVKQITNTNPQQSKYLWGTVELTKWKAFDGQELEGLIYKPENFDSTKQYPMIVYFYERYSNDIHNHYIPKPSHSVINFSEYVSNGYVVFIPDITYKVGHPAKSAYNAIVSGTEFMKKNSWINPKKIGLQGQSWGGYQTAMLVTMTNIYACAEAGAPVSNMTSAYGGIRWGSGMSRAFQYEKTQSRIGYSLWDSLDLYIENSPIFFADKVTTPLLIMHNDKDGAVPWYQGIEYFNGLRRLDKTVWMLTYNNDDHNLMKWPNRVDLSIRMQQFFDYYLKDEPMPVWMSQGIPAIDKGKKTGYELEKE